MNETLNTSTRPRASRTWLMWERCGDPRPIQLQARDDSILGLVFRHRFLQPRHLHALLGGSETNLTRRCRLLWENHYLERPKAARPQRALTEEVVYGLGKKGAQRLEQMNPKLRIGHLDWTDQRGWPYIDHQLGIADFMVTLQLACDRRGFTLHWDGHHHRKRHLIKLTRDRNRILPDAVFLIKRPDGRAAVHYLEIDRGSLSLARMRRKYETYFRWWKDEGALPLFKTKHFRVLVVTQDPRHVESLRRIARPVGRGKQFTETWKALMFSHVGAYSLAEPEKVLGPIFRYADEETPVSLV